MRSYLKKLGLAAVAVVAMAATPGVARKIATEETRSERVPGDIPVYLAYFTAWPDPDGNVRYYKDVYGRDAHLAQAIAKTKTRAPHQLRMRRAFIRVRP